MGAGKDWQIFWFPNQNVRQSIPALACELHEAMLLAIAQVGPQGGGDSLVAYGFEMPTGAKELVLMEFGDANMSQRLAPLILLCQQEPKVGSFSFISRQSQRSKGQFRILFLATVPKALLYILRKAVL